MVDWILQAKLCVYFSDGVKDLRSLGIRTILDLEDVKEEEFLALAQDTAVTVSALRRAQRELRISDDIQRLGMIGRKLGQFTQEQGDLG